MQDGEGDLEDIADALKSIQFSPTKPSSRLTALHTSAAGHPTAVQAATSHHASSRSRAPSLSSQRRNSFDERRIPPTLHEDPLAPSHTDSAAHASYASHSGARSRSGTASSHRLLRRISSDTVQSLDFDSDPETFNPGRPRSIASTRRSSLIGGIHVRDNSEQENASFAKEVRIPAFHTVGNSFGGFVAYECQVTTREGSILRSMKRYSAFCQLRDELAIAYPRFSHIVDTLPPKSLAKFRVSFLEKRRKRLAFWLSTVLLHPILGASQQAKTWVLD
ncbi:hypothetical protein P389DRAFT_197140 [Cystobasidium minutum MCA 4210]|uniref:uncharacterized protein n=1 Tax=Cystobasidium minutum MCA 4210 TaxID=1397322 RepID=UPI0034CD3197|eukprot:jgi/Rhomi1/197140/gm1.5354_g